MYVKFENANTVYSSFFKYRDNKDKREYIYTENSVVFDPARHAAICMHVNVYTVHTTYGRGSVVHISVPFQPPAYI